MNPLETTLAIRRFGLGARPGDLDRVEDPRERLLARLDDPARYTLTASGLPTVQDAGRTFEEFRDMKKRAEATGVAAAGDKPGAMLRDLAGPDLDARFGRALETEDGFSERLVWFWSNHFTVAAVKAQSTPFVTIFERDVVRANLAGTFEQMLLASSRHPAMLLYLDQAQSAGPNSTIGKARELGLNENLAREILELHTLGVHGGYTQEDVTELARALTGTTVARDKTARFAPAAQPGDPLFLDAMHEPGPRTVLGVWYSEGGQQQSVDILKALAKHPSTARHVAVKLARHFVADEPPESAVAALEKVFLESGGHLPSLHAAVVGLPEAWQPEPVKLTTPTEFLVAALRLTGWRPPEMRGLIGPLVAMGQPPFRASSPAGWADEAAAWGGPDALMKRIEWSQRLASMTTSRERPEELLSRGLGPQLREATMTAVKRAATGAQGLVLGLMSPEFQRR